MSRYLMNIILGVSVRVVFDQIHISISRLNNTLSSLTWVGLVQLLEDLKRTKMLSKREFLLPDCKSWEIGFCWCLNSTKTPDLLGLESIGFQIETITPFVHLFQTLNSDQSYTMRSPEPPTANFRTWAFSSSIIT